MSQLEVCRGTFPDIIAVVLGKRTRRVGDSLLMHRIPSYTGDLRHTNNRNFQIENFGLMAAYYGIDITWEFADNNYLS